MPEITSSFADKLTHEHVSLLEQLAALEEEIGPRKADSIESLLRHLREAQVRLQRHFHFEEQGGYMSQLLADAPHLTHAAQALLAEHVRISADLESLITATASFQVDSLVTPPLRVQLRQWVLRVRDHEARENRLTQKACNEDIGADD